MNITLLAKYGLLDADADRVIGVTGPPLSVYEHREDSEITYWKTRSYWVTLAPKCVMLLPRNANFDAMVAMVMNEDAVIREDKVTGSRTKPKK